MQNITIAGKRAHNVVFVATENDTVYAFDADTNGGANASPLWKATHARLRPTARRAAPPPSPKATSAPPTSLPIIGITGTPVIDPSTNTMYLVSASKENGNYTQRLHALDITSGAEKFGGPVLFPAPSPETATAAPAAHSPSIKSGKTIAPASCSSTASSTSLSPRTATTAPGTAGFSPTTPQL